MMRRLLACGVWMWACSSEVDPLEPRREDVCGDGVVSPSEACDDGGRWAGDGCSASCTQEQLPGEGEPNDDWEDVALWDGRARLGSLPAADVDCWGLDVGICGAVEARATGVDGSCPRPLSLWLHGPEGERVAVGRLDEAGCASLDPDRTAGARMMAQGIWSVCVGAVHPEEIDGYRVEATVLDASGVSIEDDGGADLDADGWVDRCDPDRDGDGVANEADLCPDLADGALADPWQPSTEGFLRDWLVVGPLVQLSSPEGCRPTLEDRLGPSDAEAEPALGDAVEGAAWHVLRSSRDRVDFVGPFGGVSAPRESYAAVWVRHATAAEVTLSIGADDGLRAWWNGEVVLDEAGCQGTNRDQFQATVSLTGGWDRLLVKVYDQGGGWGLFARLLVGESPVTDLDVSLSPDGVWPPPPSDLDGDGLGDLCDETPAG